jgi:diguanylate cyclase (GGDEF)-like protein
VAFAAAFLDDTRQTEPTTPPSVLRSNGLTLRRRLAVLSLIGVVFVMFIAGAGYFSLTRVQAANDELNLLSLAQRYHQDGDMMHDAIRGDVYLALHAAQGNIDVTSEEVLGALAANTAQFRDDLDQNRALALPASVRAKLDAVARPLQGYIDEANRLANLAFEDAAAAFAYVPEFDAKFVELQESQAAVTEELTSLIDQASADGDAVNRQALTWLLVAVLGAIGLLCVVTYLMTRSIVRHLGRLADVARSIARGELHARADRGADDELGSLAGAINDMAGDLQMLVGRMEASAERDGFGSQLAEALEMADTEDDALLVVERAMGVIAASSPMEILLADSSKAHLERAASHPTAGAPCCPVESPFSCVAVRRGNPVVFEHSEALNACPKLRERGGDPMSAVCVPVTFMGRALGVLHASGKPGVPFASDAVGQLTTLATQSGARIGTVRSFERSQLQASTDGLTGLRNRRTIETELRGLLKEGGTATIVMADLDHFKLLNDTYGHEAGDRALRKFSQVLEASLRPTDLCGRFGGEEFLLAFPSASPEVVVGILGRLRDALALAAEEAEAPAFTASFGVVDSALDTSLENLLKLADLALYRAKEEGRNRIIVVDERELSALGQNDTVRPAPTATPRSPATVGAFQRAAALDDPMPTLTGSR